MTLFSRAGTTAIATLMLASSAFAQTTAPAAAPTPKTSELKSPVVHSAASIECSKEADTTGLHGKERKKFRAECKKTIAKSK